MRVLMIEDDLDIAGNVGDLGVEEQWNENAR